MANETFYRIICRVLRDVNNDQDLNATNVIEKIKRKLEEEINTSEPKEKRLYSSWKERNFDINHEFDMIGSLLDIAIGWTNANYTYRFLPNVAKALIKAGANVQNGEKHLYTCAWVGSVDVLEVLLEAGVSDGPNKDCGGETALNCASYLYNKNKSVEHKGCCRLLIKHTVEENPNAKMPDSIRNNKELAEHWDTCKANNEVWKLIDFTTPSTQVQEVSAQKANKYSCSIQ